MSGTGKSTVIRTLATRGHFALDLMLTAPLATILARLAAREPGAYGHAAADRAKVEALLAKVEPLIRALSDHVVDSGGPVGQTVDAILRLTLDRAR
jgi:shikimate kinase